jgi:STE24 endopeptidase
MRRLPGPGWVRVVLGVATLVLLGRAVTLPFALALRQHRLDYGLTTQSLAGFLRDLVVSQLVTIVVTSVALMVLVGAIRRWRRAWPAVVGALLAVLVMLGSFVYPVLVEPLFYDFESLADGELRTAVLEVAEAEGLVVDDVLVADASRRTTTLNAYVSGYGDTRRVVLYDNLVEDLPLDQTLVVVAHELAHAKNQDVLVGSALGALGAAFGVGLLGLVLARRSSRSRSDRVETQGHRWSSRSRSDRVETREHRRSSRSRSDRVETPEALVPLVLALLAVGSLLASPVESAISRQIEIRADRDALVATGDADTFIEMQVQLARRSLSDPTPPAWSQFWFGSHPTVLQRVALARSLADRP